MQILHCRDKE